MPEMPHPGEHHRKPSLVGGGNYLVVADRAARLDHGRRAGFDRSQQTVGKGEESIGSNRRANGTRFRPAVGLGRWPLIWAAAAAMIVGQLVIRLPEWAELIIGIPAILAAFGAVLWFKGFGPEDRELFRMSKDDIEELQLPDPATGPEAPR